MIYEGEKDIEEAEKAILSSVIYNFPSIQEIVDINSISHTDFFSLNARRIWQAIKSTQVSPSLSYDSIAILDSLKEFCSNKSEFDQCVVYFHELPLDTNFFSIHKYLKILYCKRINKDLHNLAHSILKSSLSVDSFNDSIELWKFRFNSIISQTSSVSYKDAATAVSEFDELIKNTNSQGNLNFLKTNFSLLDKKIKSLAGGQFIVIASRPGVGKTTFGLNLIYKNFAHIIKTGSSEREPAIGVFSLEMTTSSLISKLIAINSNINLNEVQKALEGSSNFDEYFNNHRINESKKIISGLNLLFCDETNITIGKIISTVKTWVRNYDVKLIIIDYLQLINIPISEAQDKQSQYQKIGMLSRSLKILSMDLNICIVALAQLNRKSEERRIGERSPILSDLRESGSIEQDADIVMFLYSEEDASDKNSSSSEFKEKSYKPFVDSIMLKIAKNRHGPTGKIEFQFDKEKGVYTLAN